jgi:hypothetical protein
MVVEHLPSRGGIWPSERPLRTRLQHFDPARTRLPTWMASQSLGPDGKRIGFRPTASSRVNEAGSREIEQVSGFLALGVSVRPCGFATYR